MYVIGMYRYIHERDEYMALLFRWRLRTCLPFFFEVKAQPQLKKTKGQAARVPCQGKAMNYHEGFYSC